MVDESVSLGSFANVAIGADDLPLITYYDHSRGDLRLARCNDAACSDGNESIGAQVTAQFIGVIATCVYTFIVSFAVLKILDGVMGLRVSEEAEEEGLDLALHDERGYIL